MMLDDSLRLPEEAVAGFPSSQTQVQVLTVERLVNRIKTAQFKKILTTNDRSATRKPSGDVGFAGIFTGTILKVAGFPINLTPVFITFFTKTDPKYFWIIKVLKCVFNISRVRKDITV